jgi:hypothetical protein
MGKRKIPRVGAGYRGFRMGIQPKRKVNMHWEKCEVLTSLQHEIVQENLDKCYSSKQVITGEKDKDGKDIPHEKEYFADPWHIARLAALLEKPFNEAKVDQFGNPWSKPEPVAPLTEDEIKELNKKAVKSKK